MASPRLKLAETRVKILLAANRKAYSELTSSSRPTISSVVGILSGANEACMRAQSWKTLRDLPDGALFESRSGSKYIKSEARHCMGSFCISLQTGERVCLIDELEVRRLTVKEE